MPFYKFKNEHGTEYGSFEVFELKLWPTSGTREQEWLELQPGWYWWPCFPGCLPDSEMPFGPFPNEQAAINDAQEGA